MNNKRTFFQYVIPSVLSFALSGVYAIVDGFFVGNSIGDAGLSTINIAYPITAVLQSVGTGIGMGGSVKYSILKAAGNEKKAREFVAGATWLMLQNWRNVLAVYAVKVSTDEEHGLDVMTMDEEKLQLLREIFFDANKLEYELTTRTVDGEQITTLHISAQIKDAMQMADEYSFTAQQREMLEELLKPDYDDIFLSLIGNYQPDGTPIGPVDISDIQGTLPDDLDPLRESIVLTAYQLLGKVTYFWGGKSEAGWNDEWNTPKLVTAAGSSSTGTIRPYGLDCSGFTDWVYKTALGISIQAGSWAQYTSSTPISEAELLPGDLGFLLNDGGTTDHVLIFAGYDEGGNRKWVHSEGGIGVHINTPGYDSKLVLRRPSGVNFEQDVSSPAYGEPLYSLEVNVTHYCACTKCCGPNAKGITASGKRVAVGMVAMSSYYPFGTQIMINGIMYTVEDRGGSGIENNIARVDIFVPDHNEALRLGRFNTTAYIYRIGR